MENNKQILWMKLINAESAEELDEILKESNGEQFIVDVVTALKENHNRKAVVSFSNRFLFQPFLLPQFPCLFLL